MYERGNGGSGLMGDQDPVDRGRRQLGDFGDAALDLDNLHVLQLLDLQLVRLRPDRPVPWYNLACSYALLGMADRAFEALERALRLGYGHIHHLRRDPDLKSLRRDPRFTRLLRRY